LYANFGGEFVKNKGDGPEKMLKYTFHNMYDVEPPPPVNEDDNRTDGDKLIYDILEAAYETGEVGKHYCVFAAPMDFNCIWHVASVEAFLSMPDLTDLHYYNSNKQLVCDVRAEMESNDIYLQVLNDTNFGNSEGTVLRKALDINKNGNREKLVRIYKTATAKQRKLGCFNDELTIVCMSKAYKRCIGVGVRNAYTGKFSFPEWHKHVCLDPIGPPIQFYNYEDHWYGVVDMQLVLAAYERRPHPKPKSSTTHDPRGRLRPKEAFTPTERDSLNKYSELN
jgi:hypothetical protein